MHVWLHFWLWVGKIAFFPGVTSSFLYIITQVCLYFYPFSLDAVNNLLLSSFIVAIKKQISAETRYSQAPMLCPASITDCVVEPLKAELAELEQLIKDQQDRICAVKANILKNEEKIQKMVYNITLSSRR